MKAVIGWQNQINVFWDRADNTDASLTVNRSTDGVTWPVSFTVPGGNNTFAEDNIYDSSVVPTYYYQVIANNTSGSSAPSAITSCAAPAVPATGTYPISSIVETAQTPTTNTLQITSTYANLFGGQVYLQVERSIDGGQTWTLVWMTNNVNAPASAGNLVTSFVDRGLTPGVKYSYRVQSSGYAATPSKWCLPYTPPVQPMPAAGVPLVPSNLLAVETGATTVALTWTDNSSGTAYYRIQRSVGNPYNDPWLGQAYTTIAVLSPGTTSFNDTGLSPEGSYYYIIQATDSTGTLNSDFVGQTDPRLVAWVNTATAGSPITADIGPGQQYPTIAAFNTNQQLPPGSVVRIHGNGSTPYYELFSISSRGTPTNPITVIGVPDTAGNLPIISGKGAICSAEMQLSSMTSIPRACCMVGPRPGFTSGFKPDHIVLQNLILQDCTSQEGYTFTDYDGTVKPYTVGAAFAFYAERIGGIKLINCTQGKHFGTG